MISLDASFQSPTQEYVAEAASRAKPLEGGLSTSPRNLAIEVEGSSYVLHMADPKNSIEASDYELHMMIQTGQLGVAPKVFAYDPDKRWAIMEFVKAPTITPQIASGHAQEIGEALKKAHETPLYEKKGKGFVAAHRERWQEISEKSAKYNTELSRSLWEIGAKANQVFEESIQELEALPSNRVANIHTDLHPRNLFWADKQFLIIDWESSCHGHPYFDLASLTIFLGLDEGEEKDLLLGYFGRTPTQEEMKEYLLLRKIRWAYTAIVNTMWTYRILNPESACREIPATEKSFRDHMQSFGSYENIDYLDFFVQVSRISYEKI